MLKELIIVYREGREELTSYYIVGRLLAALRFVLFPSQMLQFRSLNITKKLHSKTGVHDPLYFLVHTYYLSRHFTLRQRLQCAMIHHEYELKNYNCEYARRVYNSN